MLNGDISYYFFNRRWEFKDKTFDILLKILDVDVNVGDGFFIRKSIHTGNVDAVRYFINHPKLDINVNIFNFFPLYL